MKKVGIITVYGEFNYGNKLQNYACIKVLEKSEYLPETIKYTQSSMLEMRKDRIKTMLKKILILSKLSKYKYLNNQFERKRNFIIFSKRYLNIGGEMSSKCIDKKKLEEYEILSVGSDQVWNDTDFDVNDIKYFTLTDINVPRKIAFSPSIGKNSFKKNNELLFKNGIMQFDKISCREEEGQVYLEQLIGQECKVLCDPTFALSTHEWEAIEKKPKWIIDKEYVMQYFIGPRPKENLANPKYTNVIDVMDKKSIAYTAAPDEFVYLIHNAKYVETDSFHACVFSIIFGIPFKIYKRIGDDKNDMSSRLDTLMEMFDIHNIEYGRIYYPNKWSCRDKVLKLKRKELYSFVENI